MPADINNKSGYVCVVQKRDWWVRREVSDPSLYGIRYYHAREMVSTRPWINGRKGPTQRIVEELVPHPLPNQLAWESGLPGAVRRTHALTVDQKITCVWTDFRSSVTMAATSVGHIFFFKPQRMAMNRQSEESVMAFQNVCKTTGSKWNIANNVVGLSPHRET